MASLLRGAFGLEVGALQESSASFSQLSPAVYAADLVYDGEAAVVVEVQLDRREEKRRVWPLYAASAHQALGKTTWLVVVALDEGVAAWARRPITGFQGGTFAPLVIGPAEMPRIVDEEVAARTPELALLSALVHRRGPDLERVAAAALRAADVVAQRDEDRGRLYFDAVLDALGDVARLVLEGTMKTEGFEYRSAFAKECLAKGRGMGLQEGLEEGRQEGRQEGRDALLVTVRVLCRALGLEWTDARARALEALDLEGLLHLAEQLERERRWPS